MGFVYIDHNDRKWISVNTVVKEYIEMRKVSIYTLQMMMTSISILL